MSDEPRKRVTITVTDEDVGQRLDLLLVAHLPEYSRAQLRRVITAGGVQVDGQRAKPAYRLLAGQCVVVEVPDLPREGPQPEPIPLDILHEDEHLLAVNKPAGMVVHPSKGHWSGTLAAALTFHCSSLSSVGGPTRPGIVHRLDRDTSGVLVVAKTDQVHMQLAQQFEARTTQKEYLAVVVGVPDRDQDWIEQPIGAHPYQREKMAIRADHATSRPASSLYRVQQRFRGYALLAVQPKTGRTHQIRIHLAHIGCPVLCDRLYGGRSSITVGEIRQNDDQRVLLSRQALHALRLTITHPGNGRPLTLEAPLPDDLTETIELLQAARLGG